MKTVQEQNIKDQKAFVDNAFDTIEKFGMLNKDDRVLAGVSGGPDSVALLLLLLKIKEQYSLEIGIAHLNHMLRGKEADRDERFVIDLADKLNIPCYTGKKDVSRFAEENRLSFEDAARKVRYLFLKKICNEKQYSKIALGHNSDDNAELVLMNIIRGSGTKGLTGIPSVREKVIIRPLIELSKTEILSFLKTENQEYVTDSSNNDNAYLRNSIRNRLIPLIEEEYNPKIKDSLLRLSSIIKDENDWMKDETERIFKEALTVEALETFPKETIALNISFLKDCHPALIKRVLRYSIELLNNNLKKISSKHMEDAVKLLFSSTSGKSIDLPDRIRIYKTETNFFVKKEKMPLRELGRKRKAERNI